MSNLRLRCKGTVPRTGTAVVLNDSHKVHSSWSQSTVYEHEYVYIVPRDVTGGEGIQYIIMQRDGFAKN